MYVDQDIRAEHSRGRQGHVTPNCRVWRRRKGPKVTSRLDGLKLSGRRGDFSFWSCCWPAAASDDVRCRTPHTWTLGTVSVKPWGRIRAIRDVEEITSRVGTECSEGNSAIIHSSFSALDETRTPVELETKMSRWAEGGSVESGTPESASHLCAVLCFLLTLDLGLQLYDVSIPHVALGKIDSSQTIEHIPCFWR